MKMDLIYISYNSQKWINDCFRSVAETDYNHREIYIYVVDNGSTDGSIETLERVKAQYQETFGGFEIIRSSKNLGFGAANNLGASHGHSDIVCCINMDTEMFPDTLRTLSAEIANSDSKAALWEFRQFPYEHPKIYDPVTKETLWSSGAAFAVRREIFEKIGGFDPHIFMYAEDVDLSWRIRSFGYLLLYCPRVTIRHYSYQSAGEVKPVQYLNSIINNLLLRYRFGSFIEVALGHAMVWRQILFGAVFPHAQRQLLGKYLAHFAEISHFRNRKYIGDSRTFKSTFIGFDYAPIRDGAFYEQELPKDTPLVSVLVRTCGRPSILRETLLSLRNQTYPNVEIVVVEDGEPISETMIREEFSDLNILYHATGEKVGRSCAGNTAMSIAHGKYLNFLDDDDLFYADHVEVLVRTLEKTSLPAAYSFAFETPIVIYSKDPYDYQIKHYLGIHKQPFDRIMLCHHNYIPIQSIMFEKSLFEQYGGLDETLDALEDWDLWVRYAQYTDYAYVAKTTSLYRVPANRSINAKRQKELDDALIVVRNKHKGYRCTPSVYDMAMLYECKH